MAKRLLAAGHRAEANGPLEQAFAFYRQVNASGYLREVEALLAASACDRLQATFRAGTGEAIVIDRHPFVSLGVAPIGPLSGSDVGPTHDLQGVDIEEALLDAVRVVDVVPVEVGSAP